MAGWGGPVVREHIWEKRIFYGPMDQDSTLFILSFQKSVFVKRSNVHCLQFYIGPTLLTTASMRGIEIQKALQGKSVFYQIILKLVVQS